MTIPPERLADLRARKLAALVRGRWGEVAAPRTAGFPGGASLVDPATGRAFVLCEDDDAARRLGGALAVGVRADAPEVHLLVGDKAASGVLARRAALFARPPHVWVVAGAELRPAEPAPPAREPVLPPEAELYRPVLAAAGLDPVAEGGVLTGEHLGLELARVVVDEQGTRLEAGIGRFDREAGAMMYRELGESDHLAKVRGLVAEHRRADAQRHPINQLVPERWLRAVLVRHPELVGAATLAPIASAVPRRNLLEAGIASAAGTLSDGRPVVVGCSTGVDLDLVAAAADDRLAHAPDAELRLAVPEADAAAITRDLAALLAHPAEVVPVAGDWRALVDPIDPIGPGGPGERD